MRPQAARSRGLLRYYIHNGIFWGVIAAIFLAMALGYGVEDLPFS